MTSTGEDFTARSAMTSPMAAGEPQKNPNGFPIGALNAMLSALSAQAEKVNSRCPAWLM